MFSLTSIHTLWQSPQMGRLIAALGCILALTGCETVDLGDNFVPPDLRLDEDFFFCRIQPEVIAASSCASGMMGESCHGDGASSYQLDPDGEIDPSPCTDGVVTGPIPTSYQNNFTWTSPEVRSDPLSSPFYRHPVGISTHPRIIFDEGSPEAALIVEWITGGGP